MFEVIDNFLDDNHFRPIQEMIMDKTFPWHYQKNTVKEAEHSNDLYDFQFLHIFYMLSKIGFLETCSDKCEYLFPVFEKLRVLHLIRAKANLRTLYRGEVESHPEYYHTDVHYPEWQIPITTAIFYMNTNNGSTIINTGDKKERVHAVENRLVKFDSRMEHAGISSTDNKRRIVINFNYIEKK